MTVTALPARVFDSNNWCVGCGAHLADPCDPSCAFETGRFDAAVVLRLAAHLLPEHCDPSHDVNAGVLAIVAAARRLFPEAQDEQGRREAITEAKRLLVTYLGERHGVRVLANSDWDLHWYAVQVGQDRLAQDMREAAAYTPLRAVAIQLVRVARALDKLVTVWERAERADTDVAEVLAQGYPFVASLDEVSAAVGVWSAHLNQLSR